MSRFPCRLVCGLSIAWMIGAICIAAHAQVLDPNFANPATTVQLPTFGVAVDAQGVLQRKMVEDPTGTLAKERLKAAQGKLPQDVQAKSKLRKVSLVRLEQAIKKAIDAGKQPDDAMLHLAGLQRIQFVFLFPEQKDIVIAGPAEGWLPDAVGRPVGMTSGRPVLELADLLAALRTYPPGAAKPVFVGCTIDPTQEGLTNLQKIQKNIPQSIPNAQQAAVAAQTAQAMRDGLGIAKIRVFGIPAETHFANVLIEADYRMKLIGIGLETPPIKLASYLDLIGGGQHGMLQRWWFTPNYDCVRVNDDHSACELVGQGVQLQSENKLVGPDGQLAATTQPNKLSDLFTEGFTKKYPDLAARSPVFAQLRNMIDLTIAAAFLQNEKYYDRADWRPTIFFDEKALPIKTLPTPTGVETAINVVWKGNRMLALAGGGVSIRAEQALDPKRLLPDDGGKLKAERAKVGDARPADRWWWE